MPKIELVPENHFVCRFIFTKDHYSVKKSKLKHPAFYPSKKRPNEISVCDIKGLKEQQIWDIGNKYVASERNKPILARGDVKVSMVNAIENPSNDQNLYVWNNKTPHERHANIMNVETKEGGRKVLAKKLANLTKDNLHVVAKG